MVDLLYFSNSYCQRDTECSMSTIAKQSRRRDRLKREATGVELHPSNMNRENVFPLSRSWKPPIYSLKKRKK
jgi:hypothetical protein